MGTSAGDQLWVKVDERVNGNEGSQSQFCSYFIRLKQLTSECHWRSRCSKSGSDEKSIIIRTSARDYYTSSETVGAGAGVCVKL